MDEPICVWERTVGAEVATGNTVTANRYFFISTAHWLELQVFLSKEEFS